MTRQPVVFLPHGGGPWPFIDGLFDRREVTELADFLRGLAAGLPERPKALLVISAHWEERVPTVMTGAAPPILYDYYGFPPAAYAITWPAPGAPELAARVRELLGDAGVPTGVDAERGYDHGTFIPLKVSFPDADIPTVQLSLRNDLDPAAHLAIGRALAPLRDEGVLIVGSGMSFHNMRMFGRPGAGSIAEAFDVWLGTAATAEPAQRDQLLAGWQAAPSAHESHPREEHLLPLMVVAGAAGTDRGRRTFHGTFGGARISAFHYGASAASTSSTRG